MDDKKDPPSYLNEASGNQQRLEQPQMVHMNQQTPYISGQQPLSTMGYQQTTMEMGQPQVAPMQSHLTEQQSMASMNTKTGLGQQPIQPQATITMNTMTPAMVPVVDHLALCQQGHHDITTSYGPCGIITAVCCFPIGLLALLVDVEKRCTRCGSSFQ
ncbi:hypothetical protein Agabi119p4_8200 [Agaricus bisporus var. burnettii]|uniref:Membrane protein BRI3 n=1 Tax=Agaricus bisporus var. burnettii TaxID=192524 RepID=A0A8H7EY77_AGABI|nr:hypothetical protein Agabi119p4_8200 [Agaricus bisporus var. burnettii]